ncbi:MAG: hypothetical protein RBS14_04935 [Atribacterota bacterium]|nr:hypothetical protein [Atribacterota bacterium]
MPNYFPRQHKKISPFFAKNGSLAPFLLNMVSDRQSGLPTNILIQRTLMMTTLFAKLAFPALARHRFYFLSFLPRDLVASVNTCQKSAEGEDA